MPAGFGVVRAAGGLFDTQVGETVDAGFGVTDEHLFVKNEVLVGLGDVDGCECGEGEPDHDGF
ncbi:hypothetical protein [Parvibium lacunae]|nr:hypothetical protein [Parvibium lacunae]